MDERWSTKTWRRGGRKGNNFENMFEGIEICVWPKIVKKL
jgi:hypothetical protein